MLPEKPGHWEQNFGAGGDCMVALAVRTAGRGLKRNNKVGG